METTPNFTSKSGWVPNSEALRRKETHCKFETFCSRNGTRLSGLFVVALNLFMKTKFENKIDIVLEVKLARQSKPQFIPELVRKIYFRYSVVLPLLNLCNSKAH